MTAVPNPPAATSFSPRTSLVVHHFTSPPPSSTDPKQQKSDTDVDEEDLARQMDRAKLRAIDDGGRRPSLPINIPPSQTPTSTSFRAPYPLVSNIPGSSKPLPDVPSSDPGPTADFDMNYVFGQRAFPSVPKNEDPDAGGPRRMSISLDSGVNAVHEWEDTFSHFVSQGDPEFSDRRANWSFQRADSQNPRNGKTREQAGGVDPVGVWECGTLGRYWVGMGDEQPLSPSKSANSPRRNSLVVRRFPLSVDGMAAHGSSQPPTPRTAAFSASGSAIRIHIHKHSRAPAHSLFLGASNPSAAARSSILLATKKVHLHLSAKKAAISRMPTVSRKGKERTPDPEYDVLPQSPTSLTSHSSCHGVNLGTSAMGASSSTTRAMTANDSTVVDFRLPSRAPPPGYIPSFVNRDILEAAAKSGPMDVDNENEDTDSTSPSSPKGGGSRALSSHGHATYASDFASISPEVRAMFFEQLRSKHTLGGRLKRALLSQPSLSLSLTHSHSSAHPSSSSLSTEQQTFLAGVASATTAYQPPWMLMAPGFLKEENARKLRNLRSSFQAAGMFTPVRTGFDLAGESSSDERMDVDDARTKWHGHSRRSSRDSATAVDPLSSTGSGSSGKKGKSSASGLRRSSPSPKRVPRKYTRSQSVSIPQSGEHASGAGTTSSGGEGKSKKDNKVILPFWNNVLEAVAPDTMCMAIPLWDFRGEEERRRLDANSHVPSRNRAKSVSRSPPEHERKWLLVTYVPFNDGVVRSSATAPASGPAASPSKGAEPLPPHSRSRSNVSTSVASPLGSLFSPPARGAKKRPRQPPFVSPTASPPLPALPTLPLPLSGSIGPGGSSKSGTTTNPPLRSFRVVGRILATEELQSSGLRYPGADVADAARFPNTSPPLRRRRAPSGDDEPPFTAIIAVCHDAYLGHIEYIPEGLDALGFCGNVPQHVKGAITPYTFERTIGPLSDVGREVVEICWAGCLALID